MVKAENAQQLHDYWQKVEPHWRKFKPQAK